MKTDCIHYDTCDESHDSSCCGASITHGDICSDCGEHCDDSCEDCLAYATQEEDSEIRKANEAETKYEADKSDRVTPD